MADEQNQIVVEVSKDLEELIPEYIESMNNSIVHIEQLVQDKNFTEIKSEAHKMKGHGGAYGFKYISDIGFLMEGFARDNKIELVKKCLNELKTYMTRIKIEFKEDE
ncbi:MAG: Hpt domain-containing protein [Leptospiraceae bacterium]|nr:Hpt domain-containing protein [Leptospiraceae bacterium]